MQAIFWRYLLFSFLGFIIETAFALVVRGVIENRRTSRFLPLCPVYGVGAVVLYYSLAPPVNMFVTFAAGAVLGTAVEYAYSFICEKTFNVVPWDYSDLKFNLDGRVQLHFSVLWGLLSVVYIYFICPYFEILTGGIQSILDAVYYPALIIAAADAVLTYRMLLLIGRGGTYNSCPVFKRAGGAD